MPGPFGSYSTSMDPYAVAATGGRPFGSPFGGDPSFRGQLGWEALTNAGLGLLQASGPSPYPQDLGTAFGALAGGAVRGIAGAEDRYLKRALTAAQVAQANEKIRQGQAWRDLFTTNFGGGSGAASGTPDPTNPGTPTPLQPSGAGGGAPNPNNVGNITSVAGGFKQYGSPQEGAADLTNLLRQYPVQYNQGQPMTLNQIAVKYAPADDGKDPMLKGNDPTVWARNVGQIAGLDPNQPLDFDNPAITTAVVRGINAHEKGRGAAQPAAVLAQGAAQGLDPTAFPPSPATAPPTVQPPMAATPVQHTPPAAAQQPKTLQQVIQTMPPAARQIVAAMGPEAGIKEVMKYADPESVPAFDPRSGQLVFVPKTALGSGQYQPSEAANLRLQGEWVRGKDGVQRWVPKSQLGAGTEQYDKQPDPGTEAGDVAVLNRALSDPAFARTPDYAAAYNRISTKLIDGTGGIKYAPNMSAYPPPGGVSPQGGPPSVAQPKTTAGPGGMTQFGERNYTESQNRDHTYSARLNVAIPQLEALLKDADGKYSTAKLPGSFQRMLGEGSFLGVGAPEWMIGDKEKEFRRVVRDIMTATLRRESGATIQPNEFTAEAQKFIPLPGDPPQVVENKLNALKIAAGSIAEGTGRERSVYPNITGATPAPRAPGGGANFNYVPGKGLVPR